MIENRDIGEVRYRHIINANRGGVLTVEILNGRVWLTRYVESDKNRVIDCVGFPPSAITGVITLLKSAAQVLGYETE